MPQHLAGVHLPIDRLSPYLRIVARVGRMDRGLGERVITDHEFLFFQRGGGRFRIGEAEYAIAPGTLFVIPPGIAHAFTAPDAGRPYGFLSLHFDPWFEPGREREGYLGSPATPPDADRWLADGACRAWLPHHLPLREPRLYERLFASVHRLFPRRDLVLTGAPLPGAPYERVRLAAAALDLLSLVLAEAAAPSARLSAGQREAAERAAELLSSHTGPMPLSALARRVGLSRTQLARCFTLRYGIPPARFHLRQRITCAQDELVNNGRPIKHVAERLGFASVHQFTRCFARVCGMPPATWRASRASAGLVPEAIRRS